MARHDMPCFSRGVDAVANVQTAQNRLWYEAAVAVLAGV